MEISDIVKATNFRSNTLLSINCKLKLKNVKEKGLTKKTLKWLNKTRVLIV